MPEASAQYLREAASAAHQRGDTDAAAEIYREIVERFPGSPQAVDAVFYLSSLGARGGRRPPKRVDTPVKPDDESSD